MKKLFVLAVALLALGVTAVCVQAKTQANPCCASGEKCCSVVSDCCQ